MLAPVVASVLYDKGRVLPLAVFGPSTLLVTVFCCEFYGGTEPRVITVELHSLYLFMKLPARGGIIHTP